VPINRQHFHSEGDLATMFQSRSATVPLAENLLVLGLMPLLLPFQPHRPRIAGGCCPNGQTSNQTQRCRPETSSEPDGTPMSPCASMLPHAERTQYRCWMSQDTYIRPPDGNYGSATNLAIGWHSSGGLGAMRMLLQFNLSGIPSNATVTVPPLPLPVRGFRH
jgi:hypothetical protein